MDIKISCIIPYYNVEQKLLRQCIDSILKQTFEEYEILLVNDGSDELFAEYLKNISELDNRIVVINQKKSGVSAARNTGMRYAQGEYVAFVDADDLITPIFFSEAYRIAKERDASYVVGCSVYSSEREFDGELATDPVVEEMKSSEYRPSLIILEERPLIPAGGSIGRGPVARLIKREIAIQVPFPENVTLGEDIIWNLDVIAKTEKVCIVYQIWYLYWKNEISASHRYDEEICTIVEQHLIELAKRIDFGDESEVESYFLHVYEVLLLHVYRCYLGRKECNLPVRERNRMFYELVKKEPWSLYQGHLTLKHCDKRTLRKYRLLHSGMLFRFWYIRDRIGSRNRS